MTAITDTRKRSRDEDTCDFMPISKRINNLTLTSQSFGEAETSNGIGTGAGINGDVTPNYFMTINNHEIQSHHLAQPSLVHGYSNHMSHHYVNHQTQDPNFHQSHVVQTANHSNGFHNNGSHLAIGTNAHLKPNQSHHHHHHHHHHSHTEPNATSNNNANNSNNNSNSTMDEVYSPELTADENPFYYDKNKLLFNLHVERQRRHQNH